MSCIGIGFKISNCYTGYKIKEEKEKRGGELKFIEEMAVKFGFNLKTT